MTASISQLEDAGSRLPCRQRVISSILIAAYQQPACEKNMAEIQLLNDLEDLVQAAGD
jgi:hypothetical protein